VGKLVLADVDGVILRHGQERASPWVERSVVRMFEQDSVLTLVTSRTPKMLGQLAMQLGLRHKAVLDGGATLFDFQVWFRDSEQSRWLGPEKTEQVMGAIERYCDKIYYGEDSLLYEPGGGQVIESSPSVFAVHHNAATQHVFRALSEVAGISTHPNRYENTTTHSCVQIVCEGVSKASGARLLLGQPEYAAFRPEDIVIIGDGDPDKDMMLTAPKGTHLVAVGNNPKLLEVATLVVRPAEEDGFAMAMEELVLR